MRQCLELGLHRPKPHGASQAQLEQQRRKLFWSVYIFERKSALVLGRPFAISDKDVDISMPDDDTQQNRSLAVDISTTALHRHHILLYRIHSKIRSTLHNLKRGASNDKVQSKVTRCLELLEGWKHDMLQEINSRVVDNNPAPGATSLSQSDSSDSADDTQTPLARSSNRSYRESHSRSEYCEELQRRAQINKQAQSPFATAYTHDRPDLLRQRRLCPMRWQSVSLAFSHLKQTSP